MRAIIVDFSNVDLHPDLQAEIISWARSIGVNTKDAGPYTLLVEREDGWHAHETLRVRDDAGRVRVEYATNRLVADYGGDFFIGREPNWPSWFGDAIELPDVSPPHLMEILDAAHQAQSHARYMTAVASQKARAA